MISNEAVRIYQNRKLPLRCVRPGARKVIHTRGDCARFVPGRTFLWLSILELHRNARVVKRAAVRERRELAVTEHPARIRTEALRIAADYLWWMDIERVVRTDRNRVAFVDPIAQIEIGQEAGPEFSDHVHIASWSPDGLSRQR